MTNYIPVYTYCKNTGIKKQKVYRLIREHKLKRGRDYIVKKVVVKRIRVREDLTI